MNFVAELKRRNVIRAAGLYLVAAWLATQVAGTVLPMFDAPAWLPRSIVVLLAIGFVPALVIAWIFELTPQGLKRDAAVEAQASIAPQTARRMDRLIIVVLIGALVYFGVDKFVIAPHGNAPTPASAPAPHIAPGAANADKSIAVLPFANLSEDKANAYFADGIQDEILTRLSRVAELRVISRTSTQRYASTPENVAQIAKELGVAALLEGSVQRSGDKVRINVQLIHAENDSHLWAETYDRGLADIFAVQSEVAQAVAAALQAKLSGGEKAALAARPTDNLDAYNAYLRGLVAYNRHDTSASNDFLEATRLDPNFLQAWTRLAETRMVTGFVQLTQKPEDLRIVDDALANAVRLNPGSTDTRLAQAYQHYWIQHDYAGARALFEQLNAELPNSSDLPFALSLVARRQLHFDDSIRYGSEAAAREPRNLRIVREPASTWWMLRKWSEASKVFDIATAIDPDDHFVVRERALFDLARGDLQHAAIVLDRPAAASVPLLRATLRAYRNDCVGAIDDIDSALTKPVGDDDEEDGVSLRILRAECARRIGRRIDTESLRTARTRLDAAIRESASNPYIHAQLGIVHALLGDRDKAIAEARTVAQLSPGALDPIFAPRLEQAQATIAANAGDNDAAIMRVTHLLAMQYAYPLTLTRLRLDPEWDPLRADPRFEALVAGAAEAPEKN